MPITVRQHATGLSLYARFDDASNTAVNLTAGAGLKAKTYRAEDAAIVTAGLPAGTYTAGVYVGTAAGQVIGDELVAVVPEFRWSGSAELLPAVEAVRASAVHDYGAVYFVSQASGSDSNSGLSADAAKQSLGAAKTAAAAGSLVRVLDGTFDEKDLFKDGVDWQFAEGTRVVYEQNGSGALFNDEAGPVRCNVYGKAVIAIRGDGALNRHLLHVSDADSRVFFQCKQMGLIDGTDNHDNAINIADGVVVIDCPDIDRVGAAAARVTAFYGGVVTLLGDFEIGDGLDLEGPADVTTKGNMRSHNLGVWFKENGGTYRAEGNLICESRPVTVASGKSGVGVFDGCVLHQTAGTETSINAEGANTVSLYMRRTIVITPTGAAASVSTNANLIIDAHTTFTRPVNSTPSYATNYTPTLKPTTPDRSLDVSAGGAAGVDLANVENQGSVLNLTSTTIATAGNVTGSVAGSVSGDVAGKVLGGGASVITGSGVHALNGDGENIATTTAVGELADSVTENSADIAALTATTTAGFSALEADVAALPAPLNAAGTRSALGMAAADLDAQLDAIEAGAGGGLSQPRINYGPEPAFTRIVPTYGPVVQPIRVPPGVVDETVALDMSRLYGKDTNVLEVGTPTISAGAIEAAAVGPHDYYAYVGLSGVAVAGEDQTVTVQIDMVGGPTRSVVFRVVTSDE
jgi:hypothetical protein